MQIIFDFYEIVLRFNVRSEWFIDIIPVGAIVETLNDIVRKMSHFDRFTQFF